MRKRTHICISSFTLLSILFLGLISCNSPGGTNQAYILNGSMGDTLEKKLSPVIELLMEKYDLPGVAVGIVKDDETVYAKAFGYNNIETGEPVTIRSLFHMASISKPFVATAIMQLVEQGKIDLEAPVLKYLPYFRLETGPYKEITIRQMLNHISGMPDVRDYEWETPVYEEDALEQYVRSISSEKMIANPGEKFAYSNMAFECLGDVIAKASGISFADYVEENILDPIGMHESTFLKPSHLPENWASPHTRILVSKPWEGYPYNRMHGPSSTLHSNVVEMCNWAITNMNRGIFEGERILDSTSYELLWKPWYQNGEHSHVGLSWFLGKFRDVNTIGHSGGDIGFSTDFVLVPDESLAVVVVCNLNPAPAREIKSIALDILLGYEPQHLKSPASFSVLKELDTKGLNSAVNLWDSLSIHHADEYDFGPQHFVGLFYAMDMNLVPEAEEIVRLCLEIFPDEVIKTIRDQAHWFADNNPENKAAPAVLQIIQ